MTEMPSEPIARQVRTAGPPRTTAPGTSPMPPVVRCGRRPGGRHRVRSGAAASAAVALIGLLAWQCGKGPSGSERPDPQDCLGGSCLTAAIRTGLAARATYAVAANVPITVDTEVFAGAGDSTRLRMVVLSDSSRAGVAGLQMECVVPRAAVGTALAGPLDAYCTGSLADAIMGGLDL